MNSLSAPFLYPTDFPNTKGITHIKDNQQPDDGIVEAKAFLGSLDANALALVRRTDHQLRQSGTPRFTCGFCNDPVHIRVVSVSEAGCTDGRRASFVHDPRAGQRDCPFGSFADQSSPAMVDEQRFQGRQEGARHRFLKTALCNMLRADPNIARADCEVLVTGATVDGRLTWRRPDVLAVTADGRRLAFDVQLAPPLLATITGRENFYRSMGIAWHWVVDPDQPRLLRLQGFQDLILPQGGKVLAFSEQVHALTTEDFQSRFGLLHITESPSHPFFEIDKKIISLESAAALAGYPKGGPPLVAADLRARSLYEALRDQDEERASRIFDLFAATHATPNWDAAKRDGVPGCIWALAVLIAGRKRDAVEAAVSDLLHPDQASEALCNAQRLWAPLISQTAELDPRVRARVAGFASETRLLLDAAIAAAALAPEAFQTRTARWMPLLQRHFPRLTC